MGRILRKNPFFFRTRLNYRMEGMAFVYTRHLIRYERFHKDDIPIKDRISIAVNVYKKKSIPLFSMEASIPVPDDREIASNCRSRVVVSEFFFRKTNQISVFI